MIEAYEFMLNNPSTFFIVVFFVMILLVGISEIVSAWKMRQAKALVREILDQFISDHKGNGGYYTGDLIARLEEFIKP